MWETQIIPLYDQDEGDDKYLIYRPLQRLAFVGNKALVEVIQKLNDHPGMLSNQGEISGELLSFLDEVGFFRMETIPEEPIDQLTSAVFLLTNRCQLRCTYCYAAAGELNPKVIDLDTVRTVIDFIATKAEEQGKQGFRIDFHGGGEPTLEWDVLTKSVDYARTKSIKANISITSNAIWSDQQCSWLLKNMDSMSISMDGDELTQNRNRPLTSGKPSFPIVMKNIARLDESGLPYGIRMTAVAPWDHLVNNIEFIATKTNCRGVQVEPAFSPKRGTHGTVDNDDHLQFIEAFKEAYLLAKQHKMNFRYAAARVGTITQRFCSAPYDAIVVNPDDQIVACYEVTSLSHTLGIISNLGYVKERNVFINTESRENLHSLMKERFLHCESCYCRWTCAGDCYVRTFQPGVNGHLVYGNRCEINRELTAFLLLQLISENGGVWRGLRSTSEFREHPYG